MLVLSSSLRSRAGLQEIPLPYFIRALRIAVAEDAVGLRTSCGSARERREAALQDVPPVAHPPSPSLRRAGAASHKIKARCLDLIRSIRVIRGWFDCLAS